MMADDRPPISFAQFERATRLLHGDRWMTGVAQDIGCHHRTVRKWKAAGVVPAWAADKVRDLLSARLVALGELRRSMPRMTRRRAKGTE